MNVLIAYSTKYGTVKTCVSRLQGALQGLDVSAVCLEDGTPDLTPYDIVILGGSVAFGKFRPALRDFLKKNEDALCQKPLGLFFCCGLTHENEYYMEKLFSKKLRDAAFASIYFGGVLKIANASLFDRFVLHSMRSSILESEIDDGEYTPTLPCILPENIDRLATYVREEVRRIIG